MTIYNREKIYKEVWEEPVTIVAKRYGVSDVALHKICKRLQIPVPGRGYWSQLRAGIKLEKTTLPEYEGRQQIEVETKRVGQNKINLDLLAFIDEVERQKVAEVCSNITVPEILHHPHPLVAEAKKRLMDKRHFDNEHYIRRYTNGVHVTNSSIERSLKIMDTLIKALVRLNYSVTVDDKTYFANVNIKGEKVGIAVTERVKQIEHMLTPEELTKKARNEYYYAHSFDYLPTGELYLSIDYYWAKRKNWRDGKKKRVENCIGEFIISLIHTAEEMRIQREQQERNRELSRQREIERFEMQERRDTELELFEKLENSAKDYRRAKVIQNYIEAVERNIDLQPPLEPEQQKRLTDWIEWAKGKVDWLNPITAKIDPILGEKHQKQ